MKTVLILIMSMILAIPAYANEQSELLDALGKRKLTHAELSRLDPRMNIFDGEMYYAAAKYAKLYDLLIKQWEIQSGIKLPFRPRLSSAQGDYGRSPQEWDNKSAVEEIISVLKTIKE